MKPHPERPRTCRAFSLLELLVAMTVTVTLAIFLMELLDQSTLLWKKNETQSDACREARAGLSVLAGDLANAFAGPSGSFLTGTDALALVSAVPSAGEDAIFFLSSVPSKAQPSGNNRSDICQVGYYLAFGGSPGTPGRTLNLYRYFRGSDETFSALDEDSLYSVPPSGSGGDDELVSSNVTALRIRAYSFAWDGGGVTPFVPNGDESLPDVVDISVSAIDAQTARGLQGNEKAWLDASQPALRQAVQTFTTRVCVRQN